jgi:hypothetical protein
MRDYTVSLLKAWWGAAATADNDFCFDYLPRLTGNHGTYDTVMAQIAGTVEGYFLFGQNPAVGSANSRMQRLGMSKLKWMVVRDVSLIESATWWKDGPEIESGEMRTEELQTEVFFFPAAAHTEKDGTFTNTQRMVQWHHKATEPQYDQRSDLWFAYHLGQRIRRRLQGSGDEADRPVLELTWDYPTEGEHDEPSAEAVLAEINGFDAGGELLSAYTQLRADGSTACGCWIYCERTRVASIRQRAGCRAASRTGPVRSGRGRGGPTAGSSITAPRPTRRAGRGRRARRWSGGIPSNVVRIGLQDGALDQPAHALRVAGPRRGDLHRPFLRPQRDLPTPGTQQRDGSLKDGAPLLRRLRTQPDGEFTIAHVGG